MYDVMSVQDNFHWYMENVDGVTEVISLSGVARQAASGYAEGNPKWNYVPRHDRALGFVTSIADPSTGLLNEDCTILPVYIFTEDHKATTIEHVITAAQNYQSEYQKLDQLNKPDALTGYHSAYTTALEAQETEEAVPLWCPLDEIPYDQMWADDVYWIPFMLRKREVLGCDYA
jgi:hypothetical protein